MSLSFNCASSFNLQPNILKGVPSKTHKYTFEPLHDLIDSIYFFYQNLLFERNLGKLNLPFDLKNDLMFI
jgi:hypothetical protein